MKRVFGPALSVAFACAFAVGVAAQSGSSSTADDTQSTR